MLTRENPFAQKDLSIGNKNNYMKGLVVIPSESTNIIKNFG